MKVYGILKSLKAEAPASTYLEVQSGRSDIPALWSAGGSLKNNGWATLISSSEFLPKIPLFYKHRDTTSLKRGLISISIGDHIGFSSSYFSKNERRRKSKLAIYKVRSILKRINENKNSFFSLELEKVYSNSNDYINVTEESISDNMLLFIKKLILTSTEKPRPNPLYSIPWDLFRNRASLSKILPDKDIPEKKVHSIKELYDSLIKHTENKNYNMVLHSYEWNNEGKISLITYVLENEMTDFLFEKKDKEQKQEEEEIDYNELVRFANSPSFRFEINTSDEVFIKDWYLTFKKRNVSELLEYLKEKSRKENNNESWLTRLRLFKV